MSPLRAIVDEALLQRKVGAGPQFVGYATSQQVRQVGRPGGCAKRARRA